MQDYSETGHQRWGLMEDVRQAREWAERPNATEADRQRLVCALARLADWADNH